MQICPGGSLNVPIHDITEAEAVTRSIPVKIIANNEQKNMHSELNIMQTCQWIHNTLVFKHIAHDHWVISLPNICTTMWKVRKCLNLTTVLKFFLFSCPFATLTLTPSIQYPLQPMLALAMADAIFLQSWLLILLSTRSELIISDDYLVPDFSKFPKLRYICPVFTNSLLNCAQLVKF